MAVPVSAFRRLFHQGNLLVVLFLFAATWALAQDTDAASQIKAAFVQKFATYVTGPGTAFEATEGPLVFGVAGSEPVYEFLAQLAAQGGGTRPTEVRRVASTDDLAGVHVLYIGEGAADGAAALLERGIAESMLTITDFAGPQPANSMIHFFILEDRVRFDIALAPAEMAGLMLSSRLLQVARVVVND